MLVNSFLNYIIDNGEDNKFSGCQLLKVSNFLFKILQMPPIVYEDVTIKTFNVRGLIKNKRKIKKSRNYWLGMLIVIILMYAASKKPKSKKAF